MGSENANLLSVYCPFINGVYGFTYTRQNYDTKGISPSRPHIASDSTTSTSVKLAKREKPVSSICNGVMHHQKRSSISNCPKGHVINVTFHDDKCFSAFPNDGRIGSRTNVVKPDKYKNMSFDCLGHWPAAIPGEKYVTLVEKSSLTNDQRRYRCAVSQ